MRLGSGVPFLMIEARQRVDAFDALIDSEGVIVYQVQTASPQGTAQAGVAPVQLLTTTALRVGQQVKVRGNVTVKVLQALPGGFSVSVDDTHRAIGFVTSYENERVDPDRPPGPNNPMVQSLEIDSMPGFFFTATGGPSFATVVSKAQTGHRRVEVVYRPIGPQSGTLLDVNLKERPPHALSPPRRLARR